MDHYSCLQYVHLMTCLTLQETVNAKQVFEHFAEQHGIQTLCYLCNNGQFANNDFRSACASAGQHLSFCDVNAHFQNGIAKKAICNLHETQGNSC
jgi:hypothetical protein